MIKLKSITALITVAFSPLICMWPEYIQPSSSEYKRLRGLKTEGSYLDKYFTNVLDRNKDIQSILEIGSRDCLDALKLSYKYRCHVFAFECNPTMLETCRKNIGSNPNVTLVEKAVWDRTKKISFYPMVEEGSVFYNPGTSSCFKINPQSHLKGYVQKEITVDAVRLDDWLLSMDIENVDLICMDVQGATYNVLKGLGDKLKNVKYIITEIEHKEIYEGEVLKDTLDDFLEENGFRMYLGKQNRFFGDYLYVRKDIIAGWWGEENI